MFKLISYATIVVYSILIITIALDKKVKTADIISLSIIIAMPIILAAHTLEVI